MAQIKAESGIGLLIALSLFAVMALSTMQWQQIQSRQTVRLYQQQQALLIAENQLDRMAAGLVCEQRVIQNGLKFDIEKCSATQIQVRFPLGEILIEKD